MATPPVRTLLAAQEFVQRVGLCLIFPDKQRRLPSLWEAVDLPENRPGESGWGEKVSAVWRWKNELPATFPDEIFYGKIKGGKAALMTLDHLRAVHYPSSHRPVDSCGPLARRIYEQVRTEPMTTPALRAAVTGGDARQKASFAKALVELQVTLNIARSNAPEIESDTWLRFTEQYPEFHDKASPSL